MAPSARALNYTLTDKAVLAAKPQAKPYPVADAGGLFLEVLVSGSRVWRYSYRIDGKRTKVTIGPYPEWTIKAARNKHELLRAMVAEGIDPARQKQIDKIDAIAAEVRAETFETFAKTWLAQKLAGATKRTRNQTIGWLTNDVYPAIGSLPLVTFTRGTC